RTYPAVRSSDVEDGRRGRRTVEEEWGGAHGTAGLVRGDRHRRRPDLGEVQRDLSECLDGVDVEGNAEFGGRSADLAKRLQSADLVVRGHDADERRGFGGPAQFGK